MMCTSYHSHGKKSKRKIPPLPVDSHMTDPQFLSVYEQSLHKNCKYEQTRTDKFILIRHLNAYYDSFYANCDVAYFRRSPMKQITKEIKNVEIYSIHQNFQAQSNHLTLKQFNYLQKLLPRPKIFDDRFLTSQKKILHEYRQCTRLKPGNFPKYLQNTALSNNNMRLIVPAETKVLTFCPLCHYLHEGTVLSQYGDSYLINFLNPALGALKVPQFFVTDYKLEQMQQKLGAIMSNNGRYLNLESKKLSETVDIQAFAVFLYLVELKANFMAEIRNFHALATKKSEEDSSLDENQLQQYGWLGSNVNIISIAIRFIQSNFNVKPLSAVLNRKQKTTKPSKLPLLSLSNTYRRQSVSLSEESGQRKDWKKINKNSDQFVEGDIKQNMEKNKRESEKVVDENQQLLQQNIGSLTINKEFSDNKSD